jgi:hypothetical protein
MKFISRIILVALSVYCANAQITTDSSSVFKRDTTVIVVDSTLFDKQIEKKDTTASIVPEIPSGEATVVHEEKSNSLLRNDTSKFFNSKITNTSWLFDSNFEKGVLPERMNIWGTLRFITIYRNMKTAYPDMLTKQKSFSFSDYPIVLAGPGNNGSYPMIETTMEYNVSADASIRMGYSYAHTFNSTLDNNQDKIASSRSNLIFGGKVSNKLLSINMEAGHVVWTRISRFTMGQPIYRDNTIDRMPWDWHRNSFGLYNDYYEHRDGNVGPEGFGRSPVFGTVADVTINPLKLNIKGVVGRTNRNVIQSNSVNHFPSITYALRLQRGFVTNLFNLKVGGNFYKRQADIDRTSGTKDNIEIFTGDFEVKRRGIVINGEIGHGTITNPLSDGRTGMAYNIKAELDESLSPLPFSLEYYNIDVDFLSLDGGIINTNQRIHDNGFANELVWDYMLYLNLAQEANQIANNRTGLILNTQKTFGKLKIELNWAVSQERENLYDSIVFQHRVNAFSRSRFRPWFQATGPYNRIKSSWLKTFEIMTITDEANGIATDYRKGFNTSELFLKYKTSLLGKDLILLDLITYSTIQDRLSVTPYLSDKAFIRSFYEEITLAYALTTRFMLVGHYGIERSWGNKRTNVSPENGKYIDQTGNLYAFGFDYDFAKNACIHVRHKIMDHRDKNFVLDKYKGQESTVELKIFF